ncbi:MAG: hypothetical protein D4R74_01900 [Betaproteobacteria bacterium]|nr:MAG: hypothetical protein D4R74_01900 [Betaproteobacteria bacterium]
MPYYIYKVFSFPILRLEKLEQHQAFRDASARAKELRAAMSAAEGGLIKMILAENELLAEDMLSQQRAPQPNPDDD